jgi:hypothetical protein
MSIVDDLKAEAAKLLAEAEKVEAGVKQAVVDAFTSTEKEAEKVEAEVKAEEVPAPVAPVAPAPAVTPAPAAVPAKVAFKPAARGGSLRIAGQLYQADGLTQEWKG